MHVCARLLVSLFYDNVKKKKNDGRTHTRYSRLILVNGNKGTSFVTQASLFNECRYQFCGWCFFVSPPCLIRILKKNMRPIMQVELYRRIAPSCIFLPRPGHHMYLSSYYFFVLFYKSKCSCMGAKRYFIYAICTLFYLSASLIS